MVEDLAYYKGLEEGLKEGIDSLRELLENARTLDDVLKEYNHLVLQQHLASVEIFELKMNHPEMVYDGPKGK